MSFFVTPSLFNELNDNEKNEVFLIVKAAARKGYYVSVRGDTYGDDFGDGDDSTMFLYGVYVMTPDEVDNYDRYGGVWAYEDAAWYLSEIENEGGK